ncbi:MAG: carbohydrate kinase family protein [Candidatus Verstraetearchaeota archaeon]|nr:carbohydrate kinase family protein [Candidatus Verstraetearchaeota archaeon]
MGNINADLVFVTPRTPGRGEETLAEGFFVSQGGSAANFAVGVSRLGIKCRMLGCVGEDHFGTMALESLREEDVDTGGIMVCPIGTGTVCVIVEGEHRTMIAWRGANSGLREAVQRGLTGNHKLIHVSNVPKEVLLEVLGRRKGGLVSFDPGGAASEYTTDDLHGIDLLLLNESELDAILRGEQDRRSLLQAVEVAVVKQGAGGATLLTRELEIHCPAFRVNVMDTTGAGDAFDAAFLTAVLRGHDLREALLWGCGGAALKIQKPGARAGLPRLKELIEFIGQT